MTDQSKTGRRQPGYIPYRVILHVDVDSFYVQAECVRNPSLKGRCVAVEQNNRGGFVAVSYEARQAGIRKGDGVGEGGRANLPSLRDRRSREGALRACPSLCILQMDIAYYKVISAQVYALLLSMFETVEQSSIDDFYIDATKEVAEWDGDEDEVDEAIAITKVVDGVYVNEKGGEEREEKSENEMERKQRGEGGEGDAYTSVKIEEERAIGCVLALRMRERVMSTLGMSISVGISGGKTVSRLLSPLNKPDGQTSIRAEYEVEFLSTFRIRDFPYLTKEVEQRLSSLFGITTMKEVSALTPAQLHSEGKINLNLAERVIKTLSGRDDTPVQSRGGVAKSVLVEKSCQPLADSAQLRLFLSELVCEMWYRLKADAIASNRVGSNLFFRARFGYERSIHTRTVDMPSSCQLRLRQVMRRGRELVGVNGGESGKGRGEETREEGGERGRALLSAWLLDSEVVREASEDTDDETQREALLDRIMMAATTLNEQEGKGRWQITRVVVGCSKFENGGEERSKEGEKNILSYFGCTSRAKDQEKEKEEREAKRARLGSAWLSD